MKPILSALFSLLAAYTYTITLSDNAEVIYVFTNLISSAAWVTLLALIYFCRKRYAPDTFSWVKPVTRAFKYFAAVSALRYLFNDLVIAYPKLVGTLSILYIINNMALAIAVGYASVFYRKIPVYLERAKRHQALSRRFEVIGDITVDAFLEVDALGNIWFANRGAGEMFGVTKSVSELLGLNLVDNLMAPGTKELFVAMRTKYQATGLAEIINRREPTRVDLVRLSPAEHFPAEMTVSEYEIEGQKRFCLIVRDISYRVALEDRVG